MIKKENTQNLNSLQRLRWACRRGMLELDVLLGRFLETAYEGLDSKLQTDFISLLKEGDPDIYNWLLGAETPPQEFSSIVELIRKHAKSSPRT